MVRCPACGHMNTWSVIPIQPCHHCGMFIVMPEEEEARKRGMFDGTPQPYHWELRADEVVLLFDGLDCLMTTFQEMLARGNTNDTALEALSGSFVYAKMTRARLRALVPDLQEETER